MSYNLQPYTEEDLNREEMEDQNKKLLEDGIYNFEVVKSDRQMSKTNNPMSKLTLKVWDKDGLERIIIDYLVFSSSHFTKRKILHFCKCVGIMDKFSDGALPENFSGLSGKCIIVSKEGQLIPEDRLKGKTPGSKYSPKNEVEDYLTTDSTLSHIKKESENPAADLNDDIPF